MFLRLTKPDFPLMAWMGADQNKAGMCEGNEICQLNENNVQLNAL